MKNNLTFDEAIQELDKLDEAIGFNPTFEQKYSHLVDKTISIADFHAFMAEVINNE